MDTSPSRRPAAALVYLSLLVLTGALHAPLAAGEATAEFREIASETGLQFVLDNHVTDEKRYIETMPGGVAALDYDGDGLTDIFFTNGAAIPSLEKESARYHNKLFRNLGGWKFTDVTGSAGLAGEGYSIGAAAADYDNDGNVDLFVAGVNRNILYRNTGAGKFVDVTSEAGIDDPLWAVAGLWLDYDNDGHLDLFIVNYVDWSIEKDRACGDPARGLRVYCHPKYYRELPNALYRNRGDGTFEDVTATSGIGEHTGRGMGGGIADFDGDGFQDVFVTNDYMPNFLFRNNGDGSFEESGLLSGVAFRDSGMTISNMGADFRDYDNDALPDVVVVALAGQTFPLFRNTGDGLFRDATYSSKLATLSNNRSGWSPTLADFDNDGWKDLFVSCSHVNDRIEMFESYGYKLSNALFGNQGDGTFADWSRSSGLDEGAPQVHRGSAVADFDNDGRLDIVVSSINGPAELWRNVTAGNNHWLVVRLVGVKSNRDGIGAVVQIGEQTNQMTTSYGYASSAHRGVHFGLKALETVDEVRVRWPSGVEQVIRNVPADQVLTVREH